jgi:hypothetical protein
MSRGMDNIPAVLVSGSTVRSMIVSVHSGQSPSLGSPPRKPKKMTLTRPAPSHLGMSSAGGEISRGVVSSLPNSSPTGISDKGSRRSAQSRGGVSCRAVRVQHNVNWRASMNAAIMPSMANIQYVIWRQAGVRQVVFERPGLPSPPSFLVKGIYISIYRIKIDWQYDQSIGYGEMDWGRSGLSLIH